MTNTQDLSKFGFNELKEAAKLLTKYCEPNESTIGSGIKLEFNPHSGKVFLVDEDYDVAMINYGKDDEPLEDWLCCGNCGNEGFFDEMMEDKDDLNECCQQFLIDMNLAEESDFHKEYQVDISMLGESWEYGQEGFEQFCEFLQEVCDQDCLEIQIVQENTSGGAFNKFKIPQETWDYAIREFVMQE